MSGVWFPVSVACCAMAENQELGALIRESRLKRGFSLGQLATAVGRSSASVRRWERGEVAPAATVLASLAEVLEIDLSVLERAKTSGADTEALGGDASEIVVSTVEQPAVEIAAPEPQSPIEPAEQATSQGGLFSDAWRVLTVGRENWIGWVRGFLTAGALLGMLVVLIWAVGELLDAIGVIIDSFDVGSSPGNGS